MLYVCQEKIDGAAFSEAEKETPPFSFWAAYLVRLALCFSVL
jgi:hypothetical protein